MSTVGFTPDELRQIGASGPVWVGMLRSREERLISRIYGAYKNGERDHLLSIAELACIRDQINEIVSAIKQNSAQKGAQYGG